MTCNTLRKNANFTPIFLSRFLTNMSQIIMKWQHAKSIHGFSFSNNSFINEKLIFLTDLKDCDHDSSWLLKETIYKRMSNANLETLCKMYSKIPDILCYKINDHCCATHNSDVF